MDLLNYLAEFGGWAWIVGGVVLLGIELVAPGGVFVWLGAAAVVTGIASLFQPISGPFQWVLFGVLSIASISAWLNYVRRRKNQDTDSPLLNRRAAKLIGQTATLDEPISQGYGRIALGDSTWRVHGPELDAGRRVRVTGFEGAVLSVEVVDENAD